MLSRVRARRLLLPISLAALQSGPALAQSAERPPDDGIVKVPDIMPQRPDIGAPSGEQAPGTKPGETIHLGDDDLKNDPRLADYILGRALQARAWPTIEAILAYYRNIPGHDPLMALYAQGALDREQGRHGQAIAAYREMIERDATLTYVRFDLAAMLFENKQFREATLLFNILRRDPDLAPTAQQAVNQYIAAIRSQNKWRGTLRVGYKYNDNVNNASADPYLYLFGLRFEKDPESLPHSANAINYYAGLNRDINVTGNHFLSVGAAVEGDHYWDDRDWRETTVTLRVGYKYRDIKSWLSITPSYSQMWLGGERYRSAVGASIEYGRWVSPRWQIMTDYSWFNKKYDRANFQFYDGDLHALSATAVHIASRRMVLYGGLTLQRDLLDSKDESSARDGASLGIIREWDNGFNVRANARYSSRKFHDFSLWDRATIRRDQEYQLDLSLAHNKLSVAGIIPRFSYQYLRVDSNIPSLYSRSDNQFTLSLETHF